MLLKLKAQRSLKAWDFVLVIVCVEAAVLTGGAGEPGHQSSVRKVETAGNTCPGPGRGTLVPQEPEAAPRGSAAGLRPGDRGRVVAHGAGSREKGEQGKETYPCA